MAEFATAQNPTNGFVAAPEESAILANAPTLSERKRSLCNRPHLARSALEPVTNLSGGFD